MKKKSCHGCCETLGHIFFHFNFNSVQQNTAKYCSSSSCGYFFILKHFVCVETGAIISHLLFEVLCFFSLIKLCTRKNICTNVIKDSLNVSPHLQFTAFQKQTFYWFAVFLVRGS